jgi:hypothetical protein
VPCRAGPRSRCAPGNGTRAEAVLALEIRMKY